MQFVLAVMVLAMLASPAAADSPESTGPAQQVRALRELVRPMGSGTERTRQVVIPAAERGGYTIPAALLARGGHLKLAHGGPGVTGAAGPVDPRKAESVARVLGRLARDRKATATRGIVHGDVLALIDALHTLTPEERTAFVTLVRHFYDPAHLGKPPARGAAHHVVLPIEPTGTAIVAVPTPEVVHDVPSALRTLGAVLGLPAVERAGKAMGARGDTDTPKAGVVRLPRASVKEPSPLAFMVNDRLGDEVVRKLRVQPMTPPLRDALAILVPYVWDMPDLGGRLGGTMVERLAFHDNAVAGRLLDVYNGHFDMHASWARDWAMSVFVRLPARRLASLQAMPGVPDRIKDLVGVRALLEAYGLPVQPAAVTRWLSRMARLRGSGMDRNQALATLTSIVRASKPVTRVADLRQMVLRHAGDAERKASHVIRARYEAAVRDVYADYLESRFPPGDTRRGEAYAEMRVRLALIEPRLSAMPVEPGVYELRGASRLNRYGGHFERELVPGRAYSLELRPGKGGASIEAVLGGDPVTLHAIGRDYEGVLTVLTAGGPVQQRIALRADAAGKYHAAIDTRTAVDGATRVEEFRVPLGRPGGRRGVHDRLPHTRRMGDRRLDPRSRGGRGPGPRARGRVSRLPGTPRR